MELIRESYTALSRGVSFRFKAEDVFVLIDIAIPCGIIVNELVTNAIKHAFTGRERGEIVVSLRKLDGAGMLLEVADDGIGIPAGADCAGGRTLGLQTVRMIVEHQLQGSLGMVSKNGVAWSVQLKDDLYQQRV